MVHAMHVVTIALMVGAVSMKTLVPLLEHRQEIRRKIMRRFWLYTETMIVALTVLLLVGCTGSQFLNSVSNSSVGSSAIPKPNGATPNCQNQTWCHNGWCSTHCEATISGN